MSCFSLKRETNKQQIETNKGTIALSLLRPSSHLTEAGSQCPMPLLHIAGSSFGPDGTFAGSHLSSSMALANRKPVAMMQIPSVTGEKAEKAMQAASSSNFM